MGVENLGEKIICHCGDKTIDEAIEIFQQTSLPFRKARKEVTGCSKTCCNKALSALFDMVYFGKIDKEAIAKLIE
jgi:hypothetical protein